MRYILLQQYSKERCICLILAVKNENFFKIYHYLCLLKLNDSKHV